MSYSERFQDQRIVFNSRDGKPWKPIKMGFRYKWRKPMNAYVEWLLSRGAEFEIRVDSKWVLLVISDVGSYRGGDENGSIGLDSHRTSIR